MQVVTDFYFRKAMPNGHCIDFFNESCGMRVLANRFLSAHDGGSAGHFCHKLFTLSHHEVGDLNEAMQIEICSVCGEILHATLRNFNVQV
jgi:hypothetical protein